MCLFSNLDKIKEFDCVQDALKNPNWKLAMDKEMEVLINTKTWVLTKFPFDGRPIGFKWVFKVKYKANGSVE